MDEPQNKQYFFELMDELIQEEKESDTTSTRESWHQLVRKINVDSSSVNNKPLYRVWGWKVAAAITFIVLATFGLFMVFDGNLLSKPDSLAEQNQIIRQTISGQKRTIKLPDGTQVILNSESKLIIPADYGQDNHRTVSLQGEAFFEVQENPELPFLVKTDEITTRVLGTSFNVQAYSSFPIKVAVLTGKVQVSNKSSSIDLIQDEMVIYDQKFNNLKKNSFDRVQAFGWKDGILVFQDDNFISLFKKLEKWYGVKIQLNDSIPENTISAKYYNESLSSVLEGLSFSGEFDYTISQKNVVIDFN